MSLHASGALGRVRIGAGATACIHLLPPVLKDLKQRLPSMEIVIRTGNADEMAKAVQNDTLDIGLLTLPVSGRSLEIVPVFEEAFVAIGPADQNWPATVDPNTLASSPLILYERGGNTRRLADEWLAAGGARIEPLMSLGDVEAIKELVGSGLGCSILPSLSVSRRSRRRNLAVRRLDPPLARTLALVVRKDKILRRSLRETIRAIRAIQPGASSGLANSTATIKTMP